MAAYDTDQIRAAWCDMLLPPSKSKISQRGNYQPFPNTTVVCLLKPPALCSNAKQPKLLSLPETLQRIAGDYLSPLPLNSYHATLSAGPCAIRYPRLEWKALLRDPCWSELARHLSQTAYTPTGLKLDENSIVFKRSGGVTLYFSAPTKDAQNAPSSNPPPSPYTGDEEAMAVRKEIRKRGRKTVQPGVTHCHRKVSCAPEIRNRQFAEHLMEQRDRPWHITLAYPRACGGKMPPSVEQAVKRAVVEAFSEYPQKLLVFHPARLCLSPDMTRFVPWDGLVPSPPEAEEDAVVLDQETKPSVVEKRAQYPDMETSGCGFNKVKAFRNSAGRGESESEVKCSNNKSKRDEPNNDAKADPTKRIRKLHKLLRQIEELKTKSQDSLNADQLEKLATEESLRQELNQLELNQLEQT